MIVAAGSTDVTTYFKLVDPSTGVPVTGLTITDLDATYVRERAAAVKADLTALAAVDSAHSNNKGIEIDATNAPGLYRVDWPDGAFAIGAARVQLIVNGAAIDPAVIECELNAATIGILDSGYVYFVGTPDEVLIIDGLACHTTGCYAGKVAQFVHKTTGAQEVRYIDTFIHDSGTLDQIVLNANTNIDTNYLVYIREAQYLADLDIRDALRLAPTAGGALANLYSIDRYLQDIVEDTGTTLPAAVASGATPAAIWEYAQRTLTQTSTSVISDPLAGNDITCIIATTLTVTWSGLSISATWTAIEFTAKKTLSGADTTALLQVLISNPGAGGDGLQRYMGLAGGGYVANAALTVDQPNGAVTLLVEDDVTVLLTAQKVYYDLKLMLADGSSSILVSGVFDAVYTPTKTINL